MIAPAYYPSETQIQIQVCQYLDLKGLRFCHCPNGGKRNPREAAKLKAMGVRPGVPDLLVFESWYLDGLCGFGIAIELKDHKGRATKEQAEWISDLQARGWLCGVCRSFESARILVDAAQRTRCVPAGGGEKRGET